MLDFWNNFVSYSLLISKKCGYNCDEKSIDNEVITITEHFLLESLRRNNNFFFAPITKSDVGYRKRHRSLQVEKCKG